MIRAIIALSLKFRVLVVGVAVVVMGLGVAQLHGAPVDALPEFSPPTVTIQAEALGLSAAEVEQLITVPIEQDLLNGVQWLDHMESESAPGLSNIDLIFEPDTDPLKARQAVQERLTQAHALPAVGTPPVMLQPLSSTSRVMMVGLSSDALSLTDLSVLARWKIRPRLMGIPGVANVSIWGQRDRQLQVQVDPDKLRQNGVTLNQVISTTGNALWVSPLNFLEASTPGTGGFVDTSTQRLAIQHVLPITTADNLSAVTLEDTSGRTLRLGDVASVVEDHQPLIGDALLRNGRGLMLVIQKFPEASTQAVSDGVEDALAALRPGLSGVALDTSVYQAQSFIHTALRNTGLTGLVSLALLLLVSALILVSWRRALIIGLAAVLSLVTAAYVLYLRGAGFNLMVLGGLALAMTVIIDDAVVGVGVIAHRLREHRRSATSSSITTAIAEACAAVRVPLVYATLMVMLAPLPLVLLDGVAGSFARSIVLSYVVAVTASTLVALMVVPALTPLLLHGESPQPRSGPVLRLAGRVFDRTVARCVRRPRWAYAVVVLLLVSGVAVLPHLNTRASLPTPQDRNLLVHWEAVPGTSLAEMDRITAAAAAELRSVAGVQDVGAHVGRALASDQVVDVNSGEMWVSLSDSADYDTAKAAIGDLLHGYAGLRSQIETYTQDRVDAVRSGTSTGNDLAVRVYGTDLSTLRKKAEEVNRQLGTVDGVVESRVQSQAEQPTLEVHVDLAAAQRFGLVPGDVRRAASTFFSGTLVGNLYEDQRIFDVVVWGTPSTRFAPANLGELRIDTPHGDQVRLGDVASVKVVPYPTQIRHDASSRYVEVDAQVSGRDLDSIVRDVRARVDKIQMPLEYHAEVRGDLSQRQSQDRTMTGLAIGAALVIFLLLQAAFGSWRLASLAFVALPLACVGGVVANLLSGGAMSLPAQLGLFAVLGLTARHLVLLISDYRRIEVMEGVAGAEVVLRVTRERLGSILLTAAASAAVFLPVVVAGSRAGTEVLYPMATTIVGGLVTSTVLVMFVVPALYLRFSPTLHLRGRPALEGRRPSREQAPTGSRVEAG